MSATVGPRRALSRRKTRSLVALGQRWSDRDGKVWAVRQIHRKDGLVAIVGPGAQPRYVTFLNLGKHYRLLRPVLGPAHSPSQAQSSTAPNPS